MNSLAKEMRLIDRITGRAWREFNRFIPRTKAGDRILSWARFTAAHRRVPNRHSRLFNDFLYQVKVSGALEEPLKTFSSDKEYVKLLVTACVGESYNVPTIAVLRSMEECRSYPFPDNCVIKATHCSGATILRRAGQAIDFPEINRWFSINYHSVNRERNYKALIPKVIVEPFVFGDFNPNDYKIFCVGGEPRLIQVDVDRHICHQRVLFDTSWKPLPYSYEYPVPDRTPAPPINLSTMLDVARRMSARFAFVRVDLYSNDESIYVGELTHCPESARGRFENLAAEAAVTAVLFDGLALQALSPTIARAHGT